MGGGFIKIVNNTKIILDDYNIPCVYAIVNNKNGKLYIGSTNNLQKRINEHIKDLNNNNHHSYKLQDDWNMYNKDDFYIKILVIIEKKHYLKVFEQKYISEYKAYENGYNVSPVSVCSKTEYEDIINNNRLYIKIKYKNKKKEDNKNSKNIDKDINNDEIEKYNIEWINKQKEILNKNIELLTIDFDTVFKKKYPYTYNLIKRYKDILIKLHKIAIDNLVTENFTDDEDNVLFYASIRYLSKLFKKNDIHRVNNIIGLFTYLGLVNKLKQEQIPEFLLKEAKRQAAIKKQKYLTSYYSIPSYSDNIITFSENKAKEYKEKNFTMRGFSREMLLRVLGEDEANRVYPQMKGKEIPKLNEYVAQQIEIYCLELIDYQGYTTENEILEHVKLYFKGQGEFKKTQLKKVIGEIIDKYGLKKCRVNKELRKRFNLPDNARFTIIYRD